MKNITYTPGFATDINIKELVETLPLRHNTIQMYGKWMRVPRLTSWHGAGDYTFNSKTYEANPWTPALEALRVRVSEAAGVEFNSCLANYYRDGQDSVSWHADDEKEMGPTPDNVVIASLSFGDVRRFLLRPKKTVALGETAEYRLEHGDLVIMSGDLQQTHEHSVPKTRHERDPRLNLTFRVRV